MTQTTATLYQRSGRTFKVEYGRCGETAGFIVYERGLEPDVTWSCVSGAHRTKRDAVADIDRLMGSPYGYGRFGKPDTSPWTDQ